MRAVSFCKAWWLVFAMVSLWPAVASALIVVRMETVMGDIDIELYDDVAPKTVENFLNYVRDGDYTNSMIHRSVPGFVIQGGGYTVDADGNVADVPEDPPVVNEFNLSNVRGTIAMAKLSGNPDSATSQWFFNLGDNSWNLDSQNGGFTVFGRVIGNGMDVVDSIAALPTINGGGAFTNLPVINDDGTSTLGQDNYVLIRRVVVRPHLTVTPGTVDLGDVRVGESRQMEIAVGNDGMEDLILGVLADTDPLGQPFSVLSDACSGRTLVPGDSCSLIVGFSPETEGEFVESFNIPSNDPAAPDTYVTVTAYGGAGLPAINVSPGEGLVFDRVRVGESDGQKVVLANVGRGVLSVSDVSISGAGAARFAQQNDCLAIAPGDSCEITVTFAPVDAERKSAVLTVESDDPAQPVVTVPLFGSGYVPAPDIRVTRFSVYVPIDTSEYHFGELLVGQSGDLELTVANQGEADLVIDSIAVQGAQADDYSLTHECSVLPPGEACKLGVKFDPKAEGVRTGRIVIGSNDPDEASYEVLLTGIGRESWERYTIERDSGDRIRLLAPVGAVLARVEADDSMPSDDLPEGIRFDQGFIRFSLGLARRGASGAVAIVLPEGVQPTTYYKYGPTPDNAVDHWYEFMWDGFTGAVIDGNVVTLYFIDGERGDSDLARNGVISDPGAPGFSVLATEADAALPDSESGGGGGGCSLVHQAGMGAWPVEWLAVLAFIAWLGLRRRT